MSEPVDWYTAGKLLWHLTTGSLINTHEMPERVLVHPADRVRLLRNMDPRYLDALYNTICGVPIRVGNDPTEHVAEIVYKGFRWVPVVFDPIDFYEPFPTVAYPDADALRAAGWPR
jgi:hypothetical protein